MISELKIVEYAVMNLDREMKGRMKYLVGTTNVWKVAQTSCDRPGLTAKGCTTGDSSLNTIELRDSAKPPSASTNPSQHIKDKNINFDAWTVTHEFAHAWDQHWSWLLSLSLMAETGGYYLPWSPGSCDPNYELPGCNSQHYYYGGIPPMTSGKNFDLLEDFAESVTAYIYPTYARDAMLDQLNRYSTDPNVSQDLYNLYFSHFYYDDFRKTPRGQYIASLLGQ